MGAVQIKRMVYPDKTLHLKSLSTGYSLPELLLVIAILAILVSIAVTGVASMGNDQRVNQTAYQLFHDLSHSRSSALTRGTPVIVCAGDPGQGCRSEGPWSQGWFAFIDSDRNGAFSVSETLLSHNKSDRHVTIHWRSPNWIKFTATGGAWPNGHFKICDDPQAALRSNVRARSGSGASWLDQRETGH
ncbi:MAG: prepilin-type N-terminal cleavage/methylation domain-containing protein [Gammaproteobacteria bacterium]|nr:prepilin-type N-terminal cleavage/methylation domain-containing protein [Gammaproteobacteria bacterium]